MTFDINRRELILLASAGVASTALHAQPSPARTDDHMRWWRDARFGMFVSFGPTSLIGRGDWVLGLEDIPLDEYERISAGFQPREGCAREWARLAKRSGAKYVVLTAKHHDGYCLWDSASTPFNSMNVGPRRDLVREFADAVRAEGLKVGIYFSLLDWHHPDGLKCQFDPQARERFVAFTHGQIRELLSNYGDIAVLWYDVGVPLDAAGWRSREMNAMARKLQPGIIVNHRNWLPEDYATSEQEVNPSAGDWEACMTINESWYFTDGDDLWKSPRTIVRHMVRSAQYGGNYLLNIGPRPDGSVPSESVSVLTSIGDWLGRNGEAIHGSSRSPVRYSRLGGFTRRGNRIYAHLSFWPAGEFAIGGIARPPKRAWLLASGHPLEFVHSGTRLRFPSLPRTAPDPVASVIAMEFDKLPEQDCLAGRTAARLNELYKETGIEY